MLLCGFESAVPLDFVVSFLVGVRRKESFDDNGLSQVCSNNSQYIRAHNWYLLSPLLLLAPSLH